MPVSATLSMMRRRRIRNTISIGRVEITEPALQGGIADFRAAITRNPGERRRDQVPYADEESQVPAGTSVMRAAALSDVKIPKLCATEQLEAFGSCRLTFCASIA